MIVVYSSAPTAETGPPARGNSPPPDSGHGDMDHDRGRYRLLRDLSADEANAEFWDLQNVWMADRLTNVRRDRRFGCAAGTKAQRQSKVRIYLGSSRLVRDNTLNGTQM